MARAALRVCLDHNLIKTMLLHFFSKALILLDLLLEVTFKDFKAIKNFCKSVVKRAKYIMS